MKKVFFATAFAASFSVVALPAVADHLASFEGGIGVTPAAIVGGAFVPNDVLGVAPGGRPWTIKALRADVKANGEISVRGKGLIFAGGNAIGTAGPVTQVIATLFCDGQPNHSQAAPLAHNGDFEITGMLTTTPLSPCNNATLLIRNGGGGNPGAWFAAGIPK